MTNPNGTGLRLSIFPDVRFDDEEYAQLKLRLDLYDDMVVASRYEGGREVTSFIVDPADVAQRLADFPVSSGLLPAGILFWGRQNGQERVGLWLPPARRRLAVHVEGWDTVEIPLPGLVLVGQGKRYHLWAVKGDKRPVAETVLYAAPMPNVSEAGVCFGSVRFPVATAGSIGQAAGLLLESGFNAHLANGKSRKYEANILRMWRVLHRCRAEAYPEHDLVPTRRRLGNLVGN